MRLTCRIFLRWSDRQKDFLTTVYGIKAEFSFQQSLSDPKPGFDPSIPGT